MRVYNLLFLLVIGVGSLEPVYEVADGSTREVVLYVHKLKEQRQLKAGFKKGLEIEQIRLNGMLLYHRHYNAIEKAAHESTEQPARKVGDSLFFETADVQLHWIVDAKEGGITRRHETTYTLKGGEVSIDQYYSDWLPAALWLPMVGAVLYILWIIMGRKKSFCYDEVTGKSRLYPPHSLFRKV